MIINSTCLLDRGNDNWLIKYEPPTVAPVPQDPKPSTTQVNFQVFVSGAVFVENIRQFCQTL